MPNVRMPDGTVVRFPDEMPKEQVREMIASKFPEAAQEKPFGVTDTWPFRLGRGVVRSIEDAATLPGDVYTGKQDVEDPSITGRALNFAAIAMPQTKGKASTTPAAATAPSEKALMSAGDEGYEVARSSNVALRGDLVGKWAQRMQLALRRKGLFGTSNGAETTHKILDDLAANSGDGAILHAGDYINLRQALQETAQNFKAPKDQAAATVAIKTLDKFFDTASPQAFVAGTPAEIRGVRDSIKAARGNFAAGYRSRLVTGKEHEADLRSAAANSGKNYDNTLRQRLAGAALSPKQVSGFTPAELAATEGVVRGTRPMNWTRNVSNVLGGGGGMGRALVTGMGIAPGVATGDLKTMAVGLIPPAAGWALKKTENALTKREVAKLDNMLRLRSPLGEQASAAQAKPPLPPLPMASEQALRLLTLYQLQNPDQM
jgi:hypothetical protein